MLLSLDVSLDASYISPYLVLILPLQFDDLADSGQTYVYHFSMLLTIFSDTLSLALVNVYSLLPHPLCNFKPF